MSFVGKNIDKALDRTRARTPTARGIIAQLARHADKELLSRPSQGLLARRAGITARQVRTYLRQLEALGEIEAVEKGANKPTKYRVQILSDDVVDRQHTAKPESEMDRQSTTEPEIGRSGSAASLERQSTAYEVIEEHTAQPSSVLEVGNDGIFAEKKRKLNSTASRPDIPTLLSRNGGSMNGYCAREEMDRLDKDEGFKRWCAEIRGRNRMLAK